MRDPHTPERIAQLHPKIRTEVGQLIDAVEKGFPEWMAVRVVEHYRSIDYQNQLYALGRTKRNPDGASVKKPMGNIVTNAKGGQSYHNFGLAIDFALLLDKDRDGKYEFLSWDLAADLDRDGQKDWQEVVKAFKAAGYEWGGDWHSIVDNPHLQKTFGLKESQLYQKYLAKDFIPGTEYVNL
jgi:peptidoglycan L-alanyl-D-glutamate endopeptidase CwlK